MPTKLVDEQSTNREFDNNQYPKATYKILVKHWREEVDDERREKFVKCLSSVSKSITNSGYDGGPSGSIRILETSLERLDRSKKAS
jgi:hypothetical protein